MQLYQSRLVTKTYLNKTRCIFEFKKPENFLFKEGQFISIKVGENVFRSYSIVSSPKDEVVSIYVDFTPNGIGSNFLNKLPINSIINFAGPFGNLTLPKNFEKFQYNFIATGAGISPLISILSYLVSTNLSNVTLLYSEKYMKDFFPIDHYINSSKVKIIRTVTREIIPNMHFGRVTQQMDQLTFEKNSFFYLCGNKNMLHEVSEKLKKEYNVKRQMILTESFY